LAKVRERTGEPFPEDPQQQLWAAIEAVFGSWYNDRAASYRRMNRIPHDWGTAANVQAMVFGNLGEDCATGVAFTRDPSTGVKKFFGEYLVNAQGEDVVAGIRTPQPINEQSRTGETKALKTLEQRGHIDGDGRLTLQGQARQDLGAAGRAKDRAARYAGRSPDQYAYNPATNRATLRVRS